MDRRKDIFSPTIIKDENDCWIWQGYKVNGYAYDKKWKGYKGTRLVHKQNYEKQFGPVPKGLELDHLCKNRACVNPKHLEVVTASENVRRSSSTKFNMETVRIIRELYKTGKYTHRSLARKFNTSHSQIGDMIRNRIWRENL